MTLPIDRSHIETEVQNQRTLDLDLFDTDSLVSILAQDHQQAITAVEEASGAIASLVDTLVTKFQAGGRLLYLGCGTSGRLGVLDAAECPPTFQSDPGRIIGLIAGGDRSLRTSSEGEEDRFDGAKFELEQHQVSVHDTVLGIAAGGTTPWVIGGLELARKMGAYTGFLTCSSQTPACDLVIQLHTGAEPLTGSTRLKAATATKLTLNIITTALFTRLGKVHGNLMVDLKTSNTKLHDRAIRIVEHFCELDRAAIAQLLEEAGGVVKTAVVMHCQKVDRKTAVKLLSDAHGNLRDVL
ncbi:MAG: N-acetylmuramic acid 6-phosphate etherase [Phycisphaerales bacterium]|jgi:N-acetylmuramic acid 6-phosphate etherase|nr:N-acetylmuramic acid 6-phosphate etherase [Phycisphaerales bacterium]